MKLMHQLSIGNQNYDNADNDDAGVRSHMCRLCFAGDTKRVEIITGQEESLYFYKKCPSVSRDLYMTKTLILNGRNEMQNIDFWQSVIHYYIFFFSTKT